MPLLLVFAFVAVPLLEIYVILQVGAAIGGWPTFWLLIADSVVGAWLLRVQGRRAWLEFRRALAEGRWPGDEVAQGALVLVGGTLLLTPGFVTDGVGFLLLVPLSRRLVARWVRARATVWRGARAPRRARGSRRHPGGRGSTVSGLDVEVVEVRREQMPPPGSDAGGPEPGIEAGGDGGDGQSDRADPDGPAGSGPAGRGPDDDGPPRAG